MPGIPQVWYLDIFAGKNNYAAADKGGSGGHKEINRTTLTNKDIEQGLKKEIVMNQLKIMRLRNTLDAFSGNIEIIESLENELNISWTNNDSYAELTANLATFSFKINYSENQIAKQLNF